jgi:hypothetical protein
MVNASSADELMWKGSRRITKVRRVGVGLFGFLFVLGSISVGASARFWPEYLLGVAVFFVGCKLIWNSVRKNDPPKTTKKDE